MKFQDGVTDVAFSNATRRTTGMAFNRPVKGWLAWGLVLALAMPWLSCSGKELAADDPRLIRIGTAHAMMAFSAQPDGRLCQLGLGGKTDTPLTLPKDVADRDCYPAWGNGWIHEPAIMATHADGNTSTELRYVRHESKTLSTGVTQTRIELKDPVYPFFVTLCFNAYADYDVFEQWVEVRHEEPGPVRLDRMASSSPIFGDRVSLTHYQGDWADEMNPVSDPLLNGIKVIDSKIGVRAHQYRTPSFLLSDGPASENSGEVWGGSLAWPGSFQFMFETENGSKRAICGMNPFASAYTLEAGRNFATPAMVWAWSGSGVGPMSRALHRWARTYALRDGGKPRAVLLNNWEATGMNFNQEKLVALFDGAKAVGADLFLLDDGWFGVKYPRDNDHAGLGDWVVNPKKLPGGIGYLAAQAKERGLRFGIWIEPEMVNPASELYKQHPDWVIGQPHRAPLLRRNQLILDLTRPAVKDYVYSCLDTLLGNNPCISYVKWDANRYVTQPGSSWLKPEQQGHLAIDYNNNLLDIMRRVAAKYPQVEMMVCAGGGGRVDFGSMRYFHEFWPSDNTNPRRRVTMQWDYSTFFPAIAISGHVTRMGKQPLKFALDVAMSVRLGFDVDLSRYSAEERAFIRDAIATYKRDILPVVQFGDLYRLENPHTQPRAAQCSVADDRSRAVLFVYQVKNGPATPVVLQGLDPALRYTVLELNVPRGLKSVLPQDGETLSGAELMKAGLRMPSLGTPGSVVVRLEAVAK
jgi:alpha-galactosidase